MPRNGLRGRGIGKQAARSERMAQVYISSTFNDLKEYRAAAAEAVKRLRHQPIAMEAYVAQDERPLDVCLKDVAECQVYVGLFAWRVGFKPPGQQKSITQLEYEEARRRNLPCLILLLKDDVEWPKRWRDADDNDIMALRERLSLNHTVDFFKNPDDLAARLSPALSRELSGTVSKPRSVPAMLPYLSDRSRQAHVLERALEEHGRERADRPAIIVVHGDEQEAHDRFADRLREITLPRLLKREPVAQRPVHWCDPEGSVEERVEQLQDNLARKLVKGVEPNAELLAAAAVALRSPLMLVSYIPASEWQSNEAKVITRWLDFWSTWPDLPAEQPLVVLLNIQYETLAERSFWARRRLRRHNTDAREIVDQLQPEEWPKISLSVLPELQAVRESDVIEWLNDQVEYFCRDSKTKDPILVAEQLKPRIQAFFKDAPDGRMPMAQLAIELRRELEQCLG